MSAYAFEVKIPKYMWEVDKEWGILHDDKRFIECLMKVVCGYALGSTFSNFMIELGLAEGPEDDRGVLTPTKFGKQFLYFYYNTNQARFIFEGKDGDIKEPKPSNS